MHHIPPILRLLDTLLGHAQDVTLRRGITTLGGIAEIDFPTRVITLAHDLKPGELHVALVHEFLHLLRGAAEVGHEYEEEHLVHAEVARMLAPRHLLPAILERADPTEIADRFVIDRHTARLALDLARTEDATGAA